MRTWFVVGLTVAASCDRATPLVPWDKSLPSSDAMGTWRGLSPARGIVHLHSPYSHDACDGAPRDSSGTPDEACLGDLRAALCTNHIDFAALTDHDGTMADEEFSTLFNMRGTDQPILRGGDQIASRITCEDGHEVVITVGGENDLMPIMLDRHLPGTAAERHVGYNANDGAAALAFRAAGALVWVAHTESKTLETLRAVRPDGIEIYNLHANIDPRIRGPHLGLDPAGAITAAAEFADTNPGHPEPDLALLAFLAPNQPAIERWHTLLAEGRHLPATAGSDAHQNALPIILADGERGDSYRRVLRWVSNIALVADRHDIDQIEQALGGGRMFAVFELMGTPDGFDVRATTPTGAVIELGGTVARSDGAVITVDVPRVRNLNPSLPAPTIRGRVLWIDTESGMGAQELAAGEGQISAHIGSPGAYRVEVTIVPRHLGPYLGDLGPGAAGVELPWIYTSPIYVE